MPVGLQEKEKEKEIIVMITIIVFTVVIGIQLLAIGFLIKKKIIPGMQSPHKSEQNRNKKHKTGEKENMAEIVANSFILMGALSFFSAGLQIIFPDMQTVLFLIYVVLIIPALGIKTLLEVKRIQKHS